MHSGNYGIGFHFWLIFLTIPQISMGVFLGFLRVRYGLRWSFAAHAAIDWTLISIAWFVIWLNKATSHDAALAVQALVGLLVLAVLFWGFIGLMSRNAGSDNSLKRVP